MAKDQIIYSKLCVLFLLQHSSTKNLKTRKLSQLIDNQSQRWGDLLCAKVTNCFNNCDVSNGLYTVNLLYGENFILVHRFKQVHDVKRTKVWQTL